MKIVKTFFFLLFLGGVAASLFLLFRQRLQNSSNSKREKFLTLTHKVEQLRWKLETYVHERQKHDLIFDDQIKNMGTSEKIYQQIVTDLSDWNYALKKKVNVVNNSCYLPPGYPKSIVYDANELDICGKNKLVDTSCATADCACIMRQVKVTGGRYGRVNSFLKRYNNFDHRNDRHKALLLALKKPNILEDPFVLMYFNSGFLFLFQNFLCSCEKYGIPFKNLVLAVAGDKKSEKYFKKHGINYISATDWYLRGTHATIGEQAARKFGLGSHATLNVLGIAVLNDFIQLGKTVLLQDTDMVWKKDPRNYLLEGSKKIDIQMMYDPNSIEVRGYGNTGFIFVVSNCRTKIFMGTLMHHIWLSPYFSGSDQSCWNVLLKSRPFRMISFSTLSEQKFINGQQFHGSWSKHNVNDAIKGDYYAIHVSWCNAWKEKIVKLKKVGHWYLDDPTSCTYADDVQMPR